MRLLQEIRSQIGNYHVKSGAYHYYRHEYNQAVDFLQKALRDEASLSVADLRKARHYLTRSLMDSSTQRAASGDLDQAVEELRRAAEVSQAYPDIHFRLGDLLEQQERLALAIEEYRRATECNPNYLEAQVALGFCLLRDGRAEEASEAFRHALAVKVRHAETPFRQGVERAEAGDLDGAAEFFHQAFLSSPQLAVEYMGKALDQLRAGEYEKALEDFDRALALNPKYPDLHNYRGVALIELERLAEAIDAFKISADLSPKYLVPRLNLAFAYVRAEQYKAAEAEMEKILELDPTESAAAAKLEELRSGPPREKRRPLSRGSAR